MNNKMFLSAFITVFLVLSGCGKGNPPENTENSDNHRETPAGGGINEKTEIMADRLSERAITNTISDELKSKAEQMPAASYDALPEWHGTSLINKSEYGWIPEGVDTEYTESLVNEIASEGFNFVRVPLDKRIFFLEKGGEAGPVFEGNSDQVNIRQLENVDSLIGWCIDNGIHVCFDVHSTPGGYMIGGDEEASRELLFTEGSNEELYFFDFWELFSKRYADISPNAVSFNLYNEPPTFLGEEQYVRFIKKTIDIVRPANPDRIIFVDMLNYATVPVYGLEDANIVQTFHCYEPYEFTHSGFDLYDYEDGEENRRSSKREVITYPLPAVYSGVHKGYCLRTECFPL